MHFMNNTRLFIEILYVAIPIYDKSVYFQVIVCAE